jgi:hypothetical protein
MQLPPSPHRRINYEVGSIYSLITALLLSTQEPFSFLAAKRFSIMQFVFLAQVALLNSIPLLTVRATSRRDLISLLGDGYICGRNERLVAVQARTDQRASDNRIGDHQPAAVLGSPCGAAHSQAPIPVSPAIFFGRLISAFLGALAVAWSQVGEADRPDLRQLADSALHGA